MASQLDGNRANPRMITLLCTGDLHIGRRPTRLASTDAAARCSCAEMWLTIVDTAIRRRVDAVVLTGDVVDRENRFFEAIGPLERGLRQLGEAGIDVFAVSGNHDFDVLPRLTDTLGQATFHLLGRDGTWETAELELDGKPWVRFLGWSFPEEHARIDPLEQLTEIEPSELPTIALVHGDLDVPQSSYAPLSSSRLRAHPFAAWLLGHVHAPQLIEGSRGASILYPGSPQAMDPGEAGVHGPWLLEIESGTAPRFTQLPLSRVYYDTVEIDLTGVDDKPEFQRRYFETLRQRLKELTENAPALEFVLWRVRLTGRTACHGKLAEYVSEVTAEFSLNHGQATGTVEKNTIDTQLAIDLEDLARASDPPGTLAKLLLDLDSPEGKGPALGLLQKALESIDEARQSNVYLAVADDPRPSEEDARRLLKQQGMSLLDALLAQKEQA